MYPKLTNSNIDKSPKMSHLNFTYKIGLFFQDFWQVCIGGTFSPCPFWLDGYLQRIVTIFRHAEGKLLLRNEENAI